MQLRPLRARAAARPDRLLLIAAVLLAVSCSGPPPRPEGRGRVLLDGTGAEVRVPSRAERIVSLAPDLTQTLFALGAGRSVVGVSEACDRPAGALAGLPRVGPMVQPSIESVMALRPDLVLASADGNPLETLERLRELGTTVYGVKPAAAGLEGVAERIEAVAAAAGRQPEAERALSSWRESIAAARRAAADREALSACWLVWEDPPIAAGEGTFVEALLQSAGLRNACARGDEHWPRLSREELLVAAPQALLISSGVHGDPRESLGEWAAPLPALRDGRVLRLDGDRFLRPTLELGPAARELVEATAVLWDRP